MKTLLTLVLTLGLLSAAPVFACGETCHCSDKKETSTEKSCCGKEKSNCKGQCPLKDKK